MVHSREVNQKSPVNGAFLTMEQVCLAAKLSLFSSHLDGFFRNYILTTSRLGGSGVGVTHRGKFFFCPVDPIASRVAHDDLCE
jgi:hypothetical protein